MKEKTRGIHHVGLTVQDLSASVSFFVDVLGFRKVGENSDYPAIFVSDGHVVLTLWKAKKLPANAKFDREQQLGLHHLALKVEHGTLVALHETLLKIQDCNIEFAPEPAYGGPLHMMASIPGSGIRVEFREEN